MFSRWWSSSDTDSSSEMPRPSSPTIPSELLEVQIRKAIDNSKKAFRVSGKIILTSESKTLTPRDVTLILHDWSQTYSGPFLLEGILKGIILLAGSELHMTPWVDGGKYGRTLNYECMFPFRSADVIPQKYLSYKHEGRRRAGGLSCYMTIEAEFQPALGAVPDYNKLLGNCRKEKFYPDDPASVLETWYLKILIDEKTKEVCF
ncbi:matrix [Klamath virus]|uniref:Matrix n=1 Tax=Klamath virus TaxID=909206 RepID=A0A0D3R1B6_9RHAB|nr:matrix [Klamath virus]AJR28406.1 matrix [Klamath virus]